MGDSTEIKTMRYMEWERAKGSLRAILASYWNMPHIDYEELNDAVEKFIEEFGEEGGLD